MLFFETFEFKLEYISQWLIEPFRRNVDLSIRLSHYQLHKCSSLSLIHPIIQPSSMHSRFQISLSIQYMRGLKAHIFISYPGHDFHRRWGNILINQFVIADTNLLCTTKIVSVSFCYAPYHLLLILFFSTTLCLLFIHCDVQCTYNWLFPIPSNKIKKNRFQTWISIIFTVPEIYQQTEHFYLFSMTHIFTAFNFVLCVKCKK